MELKVEVDSSLDYDREELHLRTSITDNMDNLTQKITHEVVQLKDKAVREALIKLGWTPPEGK